MLCSVGKCKNESYDERGIVCWDPMRSGMVGN